MRFLLYTTLLALTALNTIAGDTLPANAVRLYTFTNRVDTAAVLAGGTIYHLLVVKKSAAQQIRDEFATSQHRLDGGDKNLGVELYLDSDVGQTNVVSYWTCLAQSQTTPAMRTKFRTWRDTLPANAVRLYTFTNQVDTTAVLSALNLATKKSPLNLQ